MQLQRPKSLNKTERINSKLIVDNLFSGENKSVHSFPLRAVFQCVPKPVQTENKQLKAVPPVSILISVPKKRFHHAVDRNRMKRQVREAYRNKKYLLWDKLENADFTIALAFISLTDNPVKSETINKSIEKILTKIAETL